MYPHDVPVLRQELLRTLSRRQIERNYLFVSHFAMVPCKLKRTDSDISLGARSHPRHLRFLFDAITRARAHHLSCPDGIISSWAAAAYAGLPFWADNAHTTLMVKNGKRNSTSPLLPHRRIVTSHILTYQPDPEFPSLQVMQPAVASAYCLRDIYRGHHAWWTNKVPGLTFREVRAIQFLDAMQFHTALNTDVVLENAHGIFNHRTLRRLIRLSDAGAESPPETILRLIAAPLRPGLTTQIPIFTTGCLRKLLTIVDAGWKDIRVGLFYDGEHHLHRNQRDYDSEVWATMRELGWECLRVTQGMLGQPPLLNRSTARLENRVFAYLAVDLFNISALLARLSSANPTPPTTPNPTAPAPQSDVRRFRWHTRGRRLGLWWRRRVPR